MKVFSLIHLFFSSFTLFYSSTDSSLFLIGEPWLFVCPLVPLFLLVLLLLLHAFFSPYTLMFLCCVRITFVLSHFILDCGFYYIFFTYFFVFCLVGFFAVDAKDLPTSVCSSLLQRLCAVSAEFLVVSAKFFWKHLSHKVGFSFFIFSWMLSPPII